MCIILAVVQLFAQAFEIGVLWFEVHVTAALGDSACSKMQWAEETVASRIPEGDVLKSRCCHVKVLFLKRQLQ